MLKRLHLQEAVKNYYPLLRLPSHLKRCHQHQMLPWFTHIEPTTKHKNGGVKSIDPLGLEFSIQKGRIMPVSVTEPSVLLNLLKIVRCSCKIGGKTMICLCHIHGLKCTDSYKEYRWASCVNSCQEVNLDLFGEMIILSYFFVSLAVRVDFYQTVSKVLKKNK